MEYQYHHDAVRCLKCYIFLCELYHLFGNCFPFYLLNHKSRDVKSEVAVFCVVNIEAEMSFETSVTYHITEPSHNPEDRGSKFIAAKTSNLASRSKNFMTTSTLPASLL